MVILSVAYPLFPVSADSSGGAEQILHLLERGIVEAGHRSIVIAAEGSQIQGTLIATERCGAQMNAEDRLRAQQEHRRAIEIAIDRERVDLIHFHGLDFETYLPNEPLPKAATLHLPPSWYSPEVFEISDLELVCVSNSQAQAIPNQRPVTIIENGIEPIGTDSSVSRGEGLLWLGRICPEKGTHIALQVAHRRNDEITIAGPVHGFASHLEYFDGQVKPLLDDRRRYRGPVGRIDKSRLLRQSKALLVPSLAPETSSLVAMEAISAGTPVIAFDSGALPEVVEHGVTGFIVHSEEEMAEAIDNVGELSVQSDRYSASSMTANYLSLYERLIKTRHLGV